MTAKVTKQISAYDVDSLEFELEQNQIKKDQDKGYVNNKELYKEFQKYYAKKQQWIADGNEGHPPLTNKIGEAIIQIANRRCYSRSFIGYTSNWKEEMISDAIETCVRYCHNFNPEKNNNPFAYLTQIVTNAIILRIKTEHKHQYIKYKAFDQAHGFNGVYDEETTDAGEQQGMQGIDETNDMYNDALNYINDFEQRRGMNEKRKPRQSNVNPEENLLDLL